jgi:hypothetical protein
MGKAKSKGQMWPAAKRLKQTAIRCASAGTQPTMPPERYLSKSLPNSPETWRRSLGNDDKRSAQRKYAIVKPFSYSLDMKIYIP